MAQDVMLRNLRTGCMEVFQAHVTLQMMPLLFLPHWLPVVASGHDLSISLSRHLNWIINCTLCMLAMHIDFIIFISK